MLPSFTSLRTATFYWEPSFSIKVSDTKPGEFRAPGASTTLAPRACARARVKLQQAKLERFTTAILDHRKSHALTHASSIGRTTFCQRCLRSIFERGVGLAHAGKELSVWTHAGHGRSSTAANMMAAGCSSIRLQRSRLEAIPPSGVTNLDH